MKRTNSIKTFAAVSILAAGAVYAQEPLEYTPERYEVILERAPFGSDPIVDTTTEEQKEKQLAEQRAQEAAKKMRLCFLLESQNGEVRAGFQNLKPAAGDPKSFILKVDESFMGMKLIDINLDESTATMDAQGKPVEFRLAKAPQAAAAKAPAAKPEEPKRQFGGGFRRREPPKEEPEPEPQLSPEEQARRRQEIRENLQQYQMEVIRSGMPPLPIPLTQEMDDQLVAEGVLPPMQEGP